MVDAISRNDPMRNWHVDEQEPVKIPLAPTEKGMWVFKDEVRQSKYSRGAKPTPSLENDPIKEQDKMNFYQAWGDLMHEAQLASEESGLPIKDVFEELDRIQFQDQREILKESEDTLRKELVENNQQKRKINTERLEKMQEAIERAKKTQFWSSFTQVTGILQMLVSTLGTGAVSLSNPVSVVIAALAVGEAIDSLMDDPVKEFLLKQASKLLAEEDREQFQDKGLQAMKLGTVAIGIVLGSKLIPASEVNELSKAFMQLRTMTTAANITAQSTQTVYEIKGDSEKAKLMQVTESGHQAGERIRNNVKALEEMFKYEMSIWSIQQSLCAERQQVNLQIIR